MSTQNLYNSEAIKKVKDIATDVDFTMMATNLKKQPLSVVPMSTKKVDDLGNIWFLSGADSDHNADIQKDSNVQLMYSGGSDMKFLSIYGTAEITKDKAMIEELYGKTDNIWFDGKDDPNVSVIKFIPSEAAYWDSGSNKLVNLFKMAKGAITGEKQDIGTTGKLKL
ncbi:pyridoxamine 5'-phosphate oxidase family protein [Jejudonia soesokkakensis]|uniref:Pyridoxamine 5'-phosphate oxidase family protein n=1 Tax=Jejudonia soesokkakensis TaxID=1323432 RepID=A0ABW2MQW3_9FLAO